MKTNGGDTYKYATSQVLVGPLHKEKEGGSETNTHFTYFFKKK
jgi:hypothetical protein